MPRQQAKTDDRLDEEQALLEDDSETAELSVEHRQMLRAQHPYLDDATLDAIYGEDSRAPATDEKAPDAAAG